MILLLQQFSFPSLFAIFTFFSSLFPVATLHKTTALPISHSIHPTQTQFVHTLAAETTHGAPSSPTPTVVTFHDNNQDPLTGSQTSMQITVSPTPFVTHTAPDAKIITATSTISASGKTIHLFMHYPHAGGDVTGTISGDCSGTLTGNYSGGDAGTFTGSGKATCPMGFLSIPVTITYSGNLISPLQAQISYTVSAVGKIDTGNSSLALSSP